MTESGAEIERLQERRAKLAKTINHEAKLADRNRALVHQHESRFLRASEQLDAIDKKLNALLDQKLATVESIQEESGEWT